MAVRNQLTTATKTAEEFPPEVAQLMDQETALDDGALRRLWQEARGIVPDASTEELHDFFRERAKTVYRNRKLDNPTGLMLSTIHDWFSKRRVLERRKTREEDAREAAALQNDLADQLAELRSLGVLPTAGKEGHR